MTIIPVVNCRDFECARSRVALANAFPSPWVHVDVSDGKFAPVVSWNDTEEFSRLKGEFPGMQFEVHLMVERPESILLQWFDAGADRVVVHWEALTNPKVFSKYPDHSISLGLLEGTSPEDLIPFLTSRSRVHILAVPQGFSGHPFDASVMEKITALRERFPELIIEVDGGITPQTIQLIRGAADIAVSSSYIFSNPDPRKAYHELEAA